MDIKVINTEKQYHQYIDEVQRLMACEPTLNSPSSDRLELLTLVLEAYENAEYSVEPPDPIDAIKFRMEELDLKQVDLVPYCGSRSRVSEVLSRKRPLTVQMIRELSTNLGISSDTLLGLKAIEKQAVNQADWSKFPIKEILKRGWFDSLRHPAKSLEENMQTLIEESGLSFSGVSFKRTLKGDGVSPGTQYALYAWLARVTLKAREKKKLLCAFDESFITKAFFQEVAQLSWFDQGPLLAVEMLEKQGIAVVIEPALKSTLIDGAAFKDSDGTPVIGLTLRLDRLDNFWFTLLHELAHIWKHATSENAFFDDFKVSSNNRQESEANKIAREAFIPRSLWKRSDAYLKPSNENIEVLARKLRIHPAIIAGRVRRELGYSRFSDLVGQGEVRRLFNIN
ncbi:MAG: Plasmid-related protein [uncultured Thiotrichaceae bacterium]|uniref:Plasmid-related protein n=1 Tax=uncultured Thiotrichaceae bacterium TaxID=298394 RepID=A0A6S6U0N8_9GAMM|nr:MAG: Plasmid-related protein [uncultured Thiotrichaceae bacterium]